MADSSCVDVPASRPALGRRRSARTRTGVRRRPLAVYLSEDERALLEQRSEATGTSMARVLVDAALRPAQAGQIDTGALAETVALLRGYRRQLEGACTNLNQIAHHANTVSEVPADFAAVVAHVERVVDEVEDILASVRR